MMMGGPGFAEILVIAVILVLIFGAKRLPKIGEGLGKTVKELKNIKKEASGKKSPGKKKEIEDTGSESENASASEGDDAEGDLTDVIQKKMSKKVTDTVMSQVPGVKQAKQLKDKADKIKKFVS